ncbi:MAG: hypothetical protein Q8N62_03340 [Candidatus Omnitrophota bacterium]|nr:hypothetical protein [Candidatus Omnitrophota bacterium]
MPRGTRNNAVKRYQNKVFDILKRIFGEDNVEKEWNVAKNSQDDFTRELYCPRLDLAVGPFNIHRNVYEDNLNINGTLNANGNLVKRLWRASELKVSSFERFMRNKNDNPRCMLAIEIENSGSSKHMLGNIANVSILGAIGIVIPFNEKKLALCKRIKKYVAFATEVKKIEDVFKNVLIIDKDKFLRAINVARE